MEYQTEDEKTKNQKEYAHKSDCAPNSFICMALKMGIEIIANCRMRCGQQFPEEEEKKRIRKKQTLRPILMAITIWIYSKLYVSFADSTQICIHFLATNFLFR